VGGDEGPSTLPAAVADVDDPPAPSAPERALVLLPLALTAWVALPFLRPDRWVTSFDAVAYSGPNLVRSLEEIRHWRIPQWNPEIFGGVTHVGNAQTAVFEPLMWLLSPLPAHRALVTIIAAHLVVLASGMWWLLRRRLMLSPAAAAIGTMGLVGSGVVMSRSIQFEQIAVVSWVPWVLVGCDLAVAPGGSRRRLAVLPVTAALLVASGHPQQVYITIPLVAAWCIGRTLDLRGGWAAMGRLAACGVLAAGLAGAHLLPSVLALDESAIGGGRPIADAADPLYSAQRHKLPSIVLGDISAEDHPNAAGSFEALGFVGAVVAAFAVAGILRARRRGLRGTLCAVLVVGVFGAVCAQGPATGAFRALWRVVPGFDLARVPGRWMLLVVVAGSVLAAVGVDELRSGRLRRWDAALVAAVLGLVLLTTWAGPFERPRTAAWIWWGLAFVAVVGAMVLARLRPRLAGGLAAGAALLVAGELGVMSDVSMARRLDQPRPFTEMGDALTDHLARSPGRTIALTDDRLGEPRYLVPALRPNANAALGVASLDGYDGGTQVTHRWVQSVAALAGAPLDPELPLRSQLGLPVSPEVAARLGVRWLLVETAGRPPLDEIAPDWSQTRRNGTRVLLENPAWLAEARVVRASVEAPADAPQEALRAAPPEVVVLEEGAEPLRCERRCRPVAATAQRPRAGAIDVRLPSGPAGMLVVDEQASEGWSATVDGEPAPIEEANGLNLGVRVPAGAEVVELRYTAPGLRVGLITSLLAGLVLVGLLLPEGWAGRAARPLRARVSGS